jgi:hypothetical protein
MGLGGIMCHEKRPVRSVWRFVDLSVADLLINLRIRKKEGHVLGNYRDGERHIQ